MYNHKVLEAKDFKLESDSKCLCCTCIGITQEYKSGAMDPSREAAKLELLAQRKIKQI